MKLYLVQENHIIYPEKYLCFGYKALKELVDSLPCGVNRLKTIDSKEFSKEKYSNEEYSYYTHDTNDRKYLAAVQKILKKTH